MCLNRRQLQRKDLASYIPDKHKSTKHMYTYVVRGTWMPSLENWGSGLKIMYMYTCTDPPCTCIAMWQCAVYALQLVLHVCLCVTTYGTRHGLPMSFVLQCILAFLLLILSLPFSLHYREVLCSYFYLEYKVSLSCKIEVCIPIITCGNL